MQVESHKSIFAHFPFLVVLQYGHNRLFNDIDMIHVTFDYSVIGITCIFDTLDSSLYYERKKPHLKHFRLTPKESSLCLLVVD